jgi:hypothetical protein
MISEASTDLTSSSLEPHIPPTGLSKRGTSFGLPIFWFTRQDLPEAGKTTQHPQTSLFQFQLFLASLGEEEPVVVDDDAKLYELCQSYDSIAAPTEENISRVCERTGYFINNRRIWLRYWEAHTGIKLDVYLKNIKYEAFKGIFPLFLFYIEAITMILPKIKMEDLKDRCKWFVQFGNRRQNASRPQGDADFNEIAMILSQKHTYSYEPLILILWTFITAWARQYRPRMFPPRAGNRSQITAPLARFFNAIFAKSIVKLTEECKLFLSQSKHR